VIAAVEGVTPGRTRPIIVTTPTAMPTTASFQNMSKRPVGP
jgi:hypothetical protein